MTVLLFKALPISLDSIFPGWGAILMSVTLVVAFVEVNFLFSIKKNACIVFVTNGLQLSFNALNLPIILEESWGGLPSEFHLQIISSYTCITILGFWERIFVPNFTINADKLLVEQKFT